MLIRRSRWGIALLAAGLLTGRTWGQDNADVTVPPPANATDAGADQAVPPPADTPPAPEATVGPADSTHNSNVRRQDQIERRVLERNRKRYVEPNVREGDPWKKNPPVWSIRDDSKKPHPYAKPATPAPGIGHFPGGPTGRWGYPYYYTATAPDTAYGQAAAILNEPLPLIEGPGVQHIPDHLPEHIAVEPAPEQLPAPLNGHVPESGILVPDQDGSGPGYVEEAVPYADAAPGPIGDVVHPGQRAALPGQLPGNPYLYHFGPGFYRHQEAGHYRFPYYSYRRPWYFPGHPSYNRDTNVPW